MNGLLSIVACLFLVPVRGECDSATGTCPVETEANSLLQAKVALKTPQQCLGNGIWDVHYTNDLTGQYEVQDGQVKISHSNGHSSPSGNVQASDKSGFPCMVKYNDGGRIDYLARRTVGEHWVGNAKFTNIKSVTKSSPQECLGNGVWEVHYDNGLFGQFEVQDGQVKISHSNGHESNAGSVQASDKSAFQCMVKYNGGGGRIDYLTRQTDRTYAGEHWVGNAHFANINSVTQECLGNGIWEVHYDNGLTGQYEVQDGQVKISHSNGHESSSGHLQPSDKSEFQCMVKYNGGGGRIDYLSEQTIGEHWVGNAKFAGIKSVTQEKTQDLDGMDQ